MEQKTLLFTDQKIKEMIIPLFLEQMCIRDRCYAASKLWNVCNYERQHYKETGMEQYPDWYYQKKAHNEDLWYKQLPSQTAQEVCRLLDKAWKSFCLLYTSRCV